MPVEIFELPHESGRGAWSAEFLGSLREAIWEPVFVVESINRDGAPQARILWSSHLMSGTEYEHVIVGGVQVSSNRLQLRTWDTQTGTWQFQIASSEVNAGVRGQLRRGLFLRLMVASRGAFRDRQRMAFGQIAVGQVESYIDDPASGIATIVCRDLLASMISRHTTDATKQQLFYELESYPSTTLAADYATTDTTVDLTDATGFGRADDADGAILVDNGSDDPFFLTYGGKSTNTLTSVDTADRFGTTRANATTGDTVWNVVHLAQRPLTMIRQLLTSTGTGNNGSYDDCPESWGYGLSEDLVDESDISAYHAVYADGAGGGFGTVGLYLSGDAPAPSDANASAGPPENGLGALKSYLQGGGCFLAMRRGRITARCIVDPNTFTPKGLVEIDDGWIDDIERYEQYDSQIQQVYHRVQYEAQGVTGQVETNTPYQLPAARTATVVIPGVWSNHAAQRLGRAKRDSAWWLSHPERLRIRGADLRFAELTVGDVVSLTTFRVRGSFTGDGAGYRNRRALVVSGPDVDWTEGRATIELCILPFRPKPS